MIDREDRMMRLTFRMKKAFSDRLLFIGLQGSYLRGDATEDSDFDVVIVLDKLSSEDLKIYREVLQSLPDFEKACGFISGKEELLHWPKHEIFQLKQDTKAYLGNLDHLLPQTSEKDIKDSVRISVANLYHQVCHLYIFGDQKTKADELKSAYKSAAFTLQLFHYLSTKEYIHSREELLKKLSGRDREVLSVTTKWESFKTYREKQPDDFFDIIIKWCSEILTNRLK